MKVRFKKLVPEAVAPKYSKVGDGALDLVATSIEHHKKYTVYGTGIAIEIPEGYVGLLFPRSSIRDRELCLANAVGFIDANYRGEVMCSFKIQANGESSEEHIIDCPKCDASGVIDYNHEDTADSYGPCPDCNGEGYFEAYNMYDVGDKIAQLFIVERIFIEMVS